VNAHDGWLIFVLPPAELGVHPTLEDTPKSGWHELFLMCNDIEQAVAQLREKGVEFTEDIQDQGFGLVTRFKIPGAGELQLYQPKHASPLDEFSG